MTDLEAQIQSVRKETWVIKMTDLEAQIQSVRKETWVNCPSCGGSGAQEGLAGTETCSSCQGDCLIRNRDDRGRWI